MNQKYTKGFRFRTSFESKVDYFEVDRYDQKSDSVYTTVHMKSGLQYQDIIDRKYVDFGLKYGEYICLE